MTKGDRIEIVATGQRGEVISVPPKADGFWAEQYVEVLLDGDPWPVMVGEVALRKLG